MPVLSVEKRKAFAEIGTFPSPRAICTFGMLRSHPAKISRRECDGGA
jgi:hypothetical protein